MKIYEIKINYTLLEEGPPALLEHPASVVAYMKGAFDASPEQEQFFVILCDRKTNAKGRQLISLGTQNATLAHPREVFRAAVLGGACAIICVHNHPSGDPAPSAADMNVTRQLREAAKALDIQLLDHVIVGDLAHDVMGKGYYSFREAGLV